MGPSTAAPLDPLVVKRHDAGSCDGSAKSGAQNSALAAFAPVDEFGHSHHILRGRLAPVPGQSTTCCRDFEEGLPARAVKVYLDVSAPPQLGQEEGRIIRLETL